MTSPNKTEPQEATRVRKIQVPSALIFQMVDALRAASAGSREDSALLHETRDMIDDASAAWTAWQDEKMRGGR